MQLQIRASNRAFSAEVDTYANHDACAAVADQLKGFPVGPGDLRKVEIGANISLTFTAVDTLVHSIVAVDMQGDVPEQNGLKPRATFNILVNPAQIDQFASELLHLTPDFGSSASLIGT